MISPSIPFDHDPVDFAGTVYRALALLKATAWASKPFDDEALAGWSVMPQVRGGLPGRLMSRITGHLLHRQEAWNDALLQRIRQGSVPEDGGPPAVLVFAPYHIRAMRTGGAMRIFGIAGALARRGPVLVVSIEGTEGLQTDLVGPNVRLVAVPKNPVFLGRVANQRGQWGRFSHFMTVAREPELLPELGYVLECAAQTVGMMLAVSPFAAPALIRAKSPRHVLNCDFHDDMMDLVKLVPEPAIPAVCRDALCELERECCRTCHRLLVTCAEDRSKLLSRHATAESRVMIVPNGTEQAEGGPLSPDQSLRLASTLGLRRPVHLFVGSEHRPNCEAAAWINRELAPARPQDLFVVLGMRAAHRDEAHLASVAQNMVFTGPVSPEVKRAVMALSTTAIAPMAIGVGTSLKIPDYLVHGKPTLSTGIGMRGYSWLEPFVRLAERQEFHTAIERCLDDLRDLPAHVADVCAEAQAQVGARLSWQRVAEPLLETL